MTAPGNLSFGSRELHWWWKHEGPGEGAHPVVAIGGGGQGDWGVVGVVGVGVGGVGVVGVGIPVRN